MEYSKQNKEDALKRRDMSELTNMINDGVDINSLAIPKHTDVLLAAINKEHISLFNLVLSKNFQCENKNGFLYLHHAIRTNDIFFLRKLIEVYKNNKINLNEIDGENNNCLHIAAGELYLDENIFELLSNEKISWEHKNKNGQTPLHILLRTCPAIKEEMLTILKKNKQVLILTDNHGISPLDIIESASHEKDWFSKNRLLLNFIKEFKNEK